MWVHIYCQSYGGAVEQKTLWAGEMPIVPRVGDDVSLNAEWAGNAVKRVSFELEEGIAEVMIGPDHDNEFPEWTGPKYPPSA